jgi:hypothetical protein
MAYPTTASIFRDGKGLEASLLPYADKVEQRYRIAKESVVTFAADPDPRILVVMEHQTSAIAVVRGGSSSDIQALLRALADRWRGTLRLAGVLGDAHGIPGRKCGAGYLRSLATGERFPIFTDRASPTGCYLDGRGALAASDAVQRDIGAGCDLVVLNKFGLLECAGKGLAAAFSATIAARIPLLTSVLEDRDQNWRTFAGAPYVVLPVDADVVEAWKQRTLAAVAP